MAKIEGIRVKNFRGLKDISIGRTIKHPKVKPLTPMTVVIGKNGVGKSTLFDVFGFLSDALKFGVQDACDFRGGFENICSQGKETSIEFDIIYNNNSFIFIYSLCIKVDNKGKVIIDKEILKSNDIYFLFLVNNDEENEAIAFSLIEEKAKGFTFNYMENVVDAFSKAKTEDEAEKIKKEMKEKGIAMIELSDNRKLGIATLGALKQHPQISAFRKFIEGWYLSYFTPNAARSLPLAGPQKHLNIHGDNLGNVVQFMEREHQARFQRVLDRISKKIPGIRKIDTKKTDDGRLLLRFNEDGFQDPFYSQQMSDGTLKVFAYLLLLEDPNPPPFICIEEPENGLYHKLLEVLAAEFRSHATGEKNSSQMFITTHQPYFVDALNPDEVWILEKGEDGFSKITRASDNELVKNMVEEGLPLGGLWYSDYLDAR